MQRLKVMAMLDLTQTRRPQDGKVRVSHKGRIVEIRVSTVPTVCGENVVMRILAGHGTVHSFCDLGVPEMMVAQIEQLIGAPHGPIAGFDHRVNSSRLQNRQTYFMPVPVKGS